MYIFFSINLNIYLFKFEGISNVITLEENFVREKIQTKK